MLSTSFWCFPWNTLVKCGLLDHFCHKMEEDQHVAAKVVMQTVSLGLGMPLWPRIATFLKGSEPWKILV